MRNGNLGVSRPCCIIPQALMSQLSDLFAPGCLVDCDAEQDIAYRELGGGAGVLDIWGA